MIEKLEVYSSEDPWVGWVKHPTMEDIIEKINEIIDTVNTLIEVKEDE